MTKELVCAYCGKKLQEESIDADEISYIIDPDDSNIVCLECLRHNEALHYPRIKFYPSGEEVWVSENFAGTEHFRAKWISEHKYKGHWEIYSDTYEKVETEDTDSKISELKEKGVEFAVVDNNGDIGIWNKE